MIETLKLSGWLSLVLVDTIDFISKWVVKLGFS